MKVSNLIMMPTWVLLLGLIVVFFIVKTFIYIKDKEREDEES